MGWAVTVSFYCLYVCDLFCFTFARREHSLPSVCVARPPAQVGKFARWLACLVNSGVVMFGVLLEELL